MIQDGIRKQRFAQTPAGSTPPTGTLNSDILRRYSDNVEAKLGVDGSSRLKKIAAGTATLIAPYAIKTWHDATIYSTYFLFDRHSGNPVAAFIEKNLGKKTLDTMRQFADDHFGSMDDVLTFGWPILAATLLGGAAVKFFRGGNEFKSKALEKMHEWRTEICVGAITSLGILAEIFPIFTKNGILTALMHDVYGKISAILPLDSVTQSIASNVRDIVDIPFLIVGGIVAYFIFKPAQYFLDSVAARKIGIKN